MSYYIIHKQYEGLLCEESVYRDEEKLLRGHYILVTERAEEMEKSEEWFALDYGLYETEEKAIKAAKSLAKSFSKTKIEEERNEAGETLIHVDDYTMVMAAYDWLIDEPSEKLGIRERCDISKIAKKLQKRAYKEEQALLLDIELEISRRVERLKIEKSYKKEIARHLNKIGQKIDTKMEIEKFKERVEEIKDSLQDAIEDINLELRNLEEED